MREDKQDKHGLGHPELETLRKLRHDLSTPLTSIGMFLSVCQEKGLADEDLRQLLENAVAGYERIIGLM